jgi:hypothetical protein
MVLFGWHLILRSPLTMFWTLDKKVVKIGAEGIYHVYE